MTTSHATSRQLARRWSRRLLLGVAACAVPILLGACRTAPAADAPRPFAGTPLTPYISSAPAIVCRGCEMR